MAALIHAVNGAKGIGNPFVGRHEDIKAGYMPLAEAPGPSGIGTAQGGDALTAANRKATCTAGPHPERSSYPQNFRLAQSPGNACQDIEVILSGAVRHEEQEDDIDRDLVYGLEIDGLFETNEHAERFLETREARMRDGGAVPMPVPPSFSRVCRDSKMTPSGISRALPAIFDNA
jgi:hypothetical protein